MAIKSSSQHSVLPVKKPLQYYKYQPSYYQGQWDDEEQLLITYNGHIPPSTALEKLADSLTTQIHENIKFYRYEKKER